MCKYLVRLLCEPSLLTFYWQTSHGAEATGRLEGTPIYELDDLYALRNNASRYIHGHSAGGTNPSLVEAMFFGREIVAYDVVYNRETTSGKAIYFSDSESLSKILTRPSVENKTLAELAHKLYTWDTIRNKYEQLL